MPYHVFFFERFIAAINARGQRHPPHQHVFYAGHRRPLDPKVGEALCDDQDVVSVMQHPKMAEALGLLKKDPSVLLLVRDDPELEALFGKLRVMMEDKEAAMPAAPAPLIRRRCL